jgi:predicted acetylornithine/succinylornithine family transaminase
MGYKMNTTTLLDQHIMKTYGRQPITLIRGEGMYVWDDSGRRYLDCLGGIAVNGVGHCHPKVVSAIQAQCEQLMHTSNLYYSEIQNRLADKLIETTNGVFERVMFINSGAEAVETSLKIARKHGKISLPEHTEGSKTKIIACENSFHGRTMGALSATGQPKYQEPFLPLIPDFVHVPYNDLDSLQAAMDDQVCAIIVEPILGESGIFPADRNFLKYARTLCDKFGALLIFDEIQTGMGRTGSWWAYQHYDVIPDLFTTAKALGGGLPISAVVARGDAATTLVPGDHGSTFAGNPVCCAAALATFDIMEKNDLLHNATAMGDSFRRALTNELSDQLSEVRQVGLLIGVGLKQPIAKQVLAESLKLGLIVNAVGDHTIRMLPPLIIEQEHIDEAVGMLKEAIERVKLPSVTV